MKNNSVARKQGLEIFLIIFVEFFHCSWHLLYLSRNEVSQHNFSLINPENENEKSNLHFQLSLIRRSVWCVMLLVFAFRFASKLKKFFLLLLDGYFPFHIHITCERCVQVFDLIFMEISRLFIKLKLFL